MTYRKNTFYLGLLALALCASLPAVAAEAAKDEAKIIPTELSEPPYEVGDLVTEQGYYIDRGEDQPRINVRIVGNKIRLYWIDADGLIAEPEAAAATVRLTGSVRGRPYHRLVRVQGDAGLGAAGILPPPHIYNVTLVLEGAESGELLKYDFRYTATLDRAIDPTASSGSKSRAPSTY